MLTYGTQVNPSLLRQDFSPILQAAQAQAQATQQAAQMRAQTMANIGSTIGGLIQTYTQKQEEKLQNEAGSKFISDWFKSNPSMAASFKLPLDEKGEPDKKAIGEVIKGLGGVPNAVKSFMAMSEFEQQNKARQQQEQAASYAALLRQGGGQVPSPVSNQALAQFSPQARVAGEAAFLATEQARANLGKTQADTAEARARAISLATPKAALGYDTFEAANKELTRLTKAGAFGEDTVGTVKFDNGRFVIESSLKLPRQVADPEAAERIRLSGKLMDADIASGEQARRLIPQTNSMISMLEGGLETGKLAPAKARFLAYAKAAGFDVDEAQLGKAEQFQAYATQQILGFISQTKGAVSNKENELFALMGPGFDRTPEGNKLLLRAIQERQKLDAAIGDNALRAIEEGWSQAKTAQERRKLIEAYDAKLPDPKSLGVKPASAPSAPVQPGSPTRRTYNPATGQLN
jgi:hypothetical protein